MSWQPSEAKGGQGPRAAAQAMLQAMSGGWQAVRLYPPGDRLRQESLREFASRSLKVLAQGPLQLKVWENGLLLDTAAGRVAEPGGELLAHLLEAGVMAIALETTATSHALTTLLEILAEASELASRLYDAELPGILVNLGESSRRAEALEARRGGPGRGMLSAPLSGLPRAQRDERLRRAVAREESLNLRLQLAAQILRDLATVPVLDPHRDKALRALLRLQEGMMKSHDVPSVVWLHDALERLAPMDATTREAFAWATQDLASPAWLEACLRSHDESTQRALAAFLLRLCPETAQELLDLPQLRGQPELEAVLQALGSTRDQM